MEAGCLMDAGFGDAGFGRVTFCLWEKESWVWYVTVCTWDLGDQLKYHRCNRSLRPLEIGCIYNQKIGCQRLRNLASLFGGSFGHNLRIRGIYAKIVFSDLENQHEYRESKQALIRRAIYPSKSPRLFAA
jgi:hypothetical protein